MEENGVFLTPVLTFGTLANMLFVSPFSNKKLKFDATGIRKESLRKRDLIIIRDMLAAGKLTTTIDRVYNLEQIQDAHAYVDTGRKRGNVVISF
jgi:NADPH:quinone reductase-like Zn-dependent oxidoreductase